MKVTGFIELLITVAALVCGLPLFIACNIMANSDVNTVYLNDKSTWDIAMDIEWKLNSSGVLVPDSVIEPVTITAAQAAVMPYVQDEYTPNAARTILYNYNASTVTDSTLTGNEFKYVIGPNLRATRYADSNKAKQVLPLAEVNTIDKQLELNRMRTRKTYMVWNYAQDAWMLTEQYINIYELP